MNKFIILLACVVSLTAAGVLDHTILGRHKDITSDNTDRILRMSRDELLRQKFLLDVLLNVHQPLVNEELLRLADTVVVDQDMCRSKIDDEMLHVIDLIRNNRLLGKDEIFTIANDDHLRQMVGIYRLLVCVRDWDIFTRIVANIRKQGNGVLLVNTLLWAVRDRDDTQMLIVPAIHEILPELYLDEDVIRRVQNIDLNRLITNTETTRPGLMDIIASNKRNNMMNRGVGVGVGIGLLGTDMNMLTKSHLWMPWRQMRMQIAQQKLNGMGVDKVGQDNMVVIPINNQVVGVTTDDTLRTMVTDDMGLKTFVHGLVNDVILNGVDMQNHVTDDTMDNMNLARVGLRQTVGAGIHNRQMLDNMDINDMYHMNGMSRMNQMDEMHRMNQMDDMHRINQVNNINRENLDQLNRMDRVNYVGLNRNVRLGDTLPTTDINNPRLLHVNRRRLQDNTDVHMNVGGEDVDRTWMQNDRNRFLNIMHRGVNDGRRVVGLNRNTNMDDDVIGQRRMMMNNEDWLMRQGGMVGRNNRMMDRNVVNDDMMMTRTGMKLDMNMGNDNLPTTSDLDRLVHVNRRSMHQKLTMQNNLMGQSGRMDNLLMNDRRGGMMNWGNQVNNDRDTFMHLVHGGRVLDGRRVVNRDDDMIRNDNWGQAADRWNNNPNVNQDDNVNTMWNRRTNVMGNIGDMQREMDLNMRHIGGGPLNDDNMNTMWNRRNLGRGMGNIGDMHRDMDVNVPTIHHQDDNVDTLWNRRTNVRGNIGDMQREMDMNMRHVGDVNENTWQHRRVVDDDDELELIKGSMRHRVPRSLDHMELVNSLGVGNGMNQKRLIMQHLRGGEVLLHNIQQLVARINMETIALGITDVHLDNINTMNSRLNNARLIDNMDQRFAIRMNNMRMTNRRNRVMLENINAIEKTLTEVLRQHIGHIIEMHNNNIDARDISVINGIIGDVLLGRIDNRINILNIIRDVMLQTEVGQNLPTMGDVGVLMHNPVFRHTIRHILRVIDQTMQELVGTHNRNDLELVGVTINDVIVDKLRTMVDVTDHDLTNLLDNQVVNDMNVKKLVVGRQQRLNHKHFNINIDLTSDRNQQVVIRTLLVPTMDAMGRQMTLDQQRMNAIVLDAHMTNLVNGHNLIQRKSLDINWTMRDTTTLTDIYRRVMMTLNGNTIDTMHMDVGGMIVGHNCRFPHRLLLPRGHVDGLPMQLLVIVTRVEDIDRSIQHLTGISTNILDNHHLLCGIGVSSQNLDRLPLRFPMDSHIDNIDALHTLSNVHIKNVMIMHDDKRDTMHL